MRITPKLRQVLLLAAFLPTVIGAPQGQSSGMNLTSNAVMDVYFVSDNTGSMSEEISKVKQCASLLLSQLSGAVKSIRFGVGAYDNYSGGAHFSNFLSLTDDQAEVKKALNRWVSSGSGSENGLLALYRIADTKYNEIGWRATAVNMIIWFGDYPSADPFQTITEQMVIKALTDKNIIVTAIDMETLNQKGQAKRVADASGGEYRVYSSQTEAADTCNLAVTIIEAVQVAAEKDEKETDTAANVIANSAKQGNGTQVLEAIQKEATQGNPRQLTNALKTIFLNTTWDSPEARAYAELVVSVLVQTLQGGDIVIDAVNQTKVEQGCDPIYGLLVDALQYAREQNLDSNYIGALVATGFDLCLLPDFYKLELSKPCPTCQLPTLNETITLQSLMDINKTVEIAKRLASYCQYGANNNMTDAVTELLKKAFVSAPHEALIIVIQEMVTANVEWVVIDPLISVGNVSQISELLLEVIINNSSVIQPLIYTLVQTAQQSKDDIIPNLINNTLEELLFQLVQQDKAKKSALVLLLYIELGQHDLIFQVFQRLEDFSSAQSISATLLEAFLIQSNTTASIVAEAALQVRDDNTTSTLEQALELVLQSALDILSRQQVVVIVVALVNKGLYEPVYNGLDQYWDSAQVTKSYVQALEYEPRSMADYISYIIEWNEQQEYRNESFVDVLVASVGRWNIEPASIAIARLCDLGHKEFAAQVITASARKWSSLRVATMLRNAILQSEESVTGCLATVIANAADDLQITSVISNAIIELMKSDIDSTSKLILFLITQDVPQDNQVCAVALSQAAIQGLSKEASQTLIRCLQSVKQQAQEDGLSQLGQTILQKSKFPEEVDIISTAITAASMNGTCTRACPSLISNLLKQQQKMVFAESFVQSMRHNHDQKCTNIMESVFRSFADVDIAAKNNPIIIEPEAAQDLELICNSDMYECYDDTCCRGYKTLGTVCVAYSRAWTYLGICDNYPNRYVLKPNVGERCYCRTN